MYTATIDTPLRTLASIEPGERLELRRMIFDAVRERCSWSGLAEGSVVSCLAATPAHVLLHRPDGRTVAIERWWARFVEARELAESGRDDRGPRRT